MPRNAEITAGTVVFCALATWKDKGQPKERPAKQNQNDYCNNGTAIDAAADASANLLMTVWAYRDTRKATG